MTQRSDTKLLLDVQGLKKYYPIEEGFLRKQVGNIKAVDDVSFQIAEGETLGLVGESGCGKTTLGRCVLRAIEPSGGKILFRPTDDEAVDLAQLDKKSLRSLRRFAQMIFQDPYASLDPRMTVLDIIGEPLVESGLARGNELVARVRELLDAVGLEVSHLKRYPHAFSGGQRQRIGIARAVAPNPRLIVCDEPVSALDVSVQAQIINLLRELQENMALTYLFIAHDLAVVEHISDRVAVMYAGQTVELAETEELFDNPLHPYTEALLSAAPDPDPDSKTERIILSGEVADPADPPAGCRFNPRCRYVQDRCRQEDPAWEEVKPGHFVACHFAGELNLKGVG